MAATEAIALSHVPIHRAELGTLPFSQAAPLQGPASSGFPPASLAAGLAWQSQNRGAPGLAQPRAGLSDDCANPLTGSTGTNRLLL
jgi:hypothetical protein